jgi:uncharacterized protein YegJ (DUF2314 family)
MSKSFILLFQLLLLLETASVAQIKNDAPLSKNAPIDKPHDVTADQIKKLDSLIAPYVAQARATLPEAKSRFIKGLNKGESFFVTTRIFDKNGKMEQVFLRVTEYNKEQIKGTIAVELGIVKEYKKGQLISISEKDVLDWLISKPDGSEEGNFVGKFMDTQ